MECSKETWSLAKSAALFNPLKTARSEGLEKQSLKGVGSCIFGVFSFLSWCKA